MGAVQPILDKWLPRRLRARPFALRDLVLVMGKDEVFAAQVEVEAGAEGFHAHGAAFDVPAGPAFAPRAGPEDRPVIGDARFPEGEIGHRFLGVFIAADAFAGAHSLEVQLEQLAVTTAASLIFFDAEIDRAVGGAISQ